MGLVVQILGTREIRVSVVRRLMIFGRGNSLLFFFLVGSEFEMPVFRVIENEFQKFSVNEIGRRNVKNNVSIILLYLNFKYNFLFAYFRAVVVNFFLYLKFQVPKYLDCNV